MQLFLITLSIFILSSLYTATLDHIAPSFRSLQVSIVYLIAIFVLVYFALIARASWRKSNVLLSKYIILFFSTVFIQLLVIATGGFTSPLFIVIHLCFIGISFFINFETSLSFLVCMILSLVADAYLYRELLNTLIVQPTTIILQISSIIPIVPIAYIISQRYHSKEKISDQLLSQVKANKAILESVQDSIIITDDDLRILSVNDAALKLFGMSRSALLERNIFEVLFLRDKNYKLVTKDTFKIKRSVNEFTLARSFLPNDKVNIYIQPHLTNGAVQQVHFIISYSPYVSHANQSLDLTIEKAYIQYDAMSESIKHALLVNGDRTLGLQMLLLQKMISDISETQALQTNKINSVIAKVDVAQLCKQVTRLEQEFADLLRVSLKFDILHFGQKDIRHLVSKQYKVDIDKMTGPFFTVHCDMKQLEVLIKKMLEFTILLSYTQQKPLVDLTIERSKANALLIKISGHCPQLNRDDLSHIFTPYYEKIYTKMHLNYYSGLEGYLVKTLSKNLGFTLHTHYYAAKTPKITFELTIKK